MHQLKQLNLASTNLALFHAAALCVLFKPMAVPSVNVCIIISQISIQKEIFKRKRNVQLTTTSHFFKSAILFLPEFHSRKLISSFSGSRPLPASRPASHVTKTHYFQAAITSRKELYYFAFLRSSSIMVDYIKSFGREQSRQHKQRAVLRTFDVQSLNFCLEGKT